MFHIACFDHLSDWFYGLFNGNFRINSAEPKRHIPYVTELDGTEAAEFGLILAKAAKAIKTATGAKMVYVYVYGDHIPHIHIHMAPHTDGDNYVNDVIRNDVKIDENVMDSEEALPLLEKIRERLANPTAR